MAKRLDDGSILVEHLTGCARCHGEGHEGLVFAPLTHPLELEDGLPPMTHWAPCPTNGEPIMLSEAGE